MKKKRNIIMGLIAIFIIIFSWYFFDKFSYSKVLPFYSVKANNDTAGLTIGIIGASSVAGSQLDTFLHDDLLEKGIQSKIISSGQYGATSKIIYQNIFKESGQEFSTKPIIESQPDYCIVVGGVNDAISQLGAKYYSYHTIQTIKALLHYNIKPVIVTLPEFGIKETTDKMNFFSRNMNKIIAFFNNHGDINNIRAYRKRFEEDLAAENLKDSIILIDYDKVCADYKKCPELYVNSAHLSQKGNEFFCRVITNDLLKNIIPR